jgi:hypothetical protein
MMCDVVVTEEPACKQANDTVERMTDILNQIWSAVTRGSGTWSYRRQVVSAVENVMRRLDQVEQELAERREVRNPTSPTQYGGRELKVLEDAARRGIQIRYEHLEQMAAAYYLVTNADPREIELVEEQVSPTRTVWYFRKRGAVHDQD